MTYKYSPEDARTIAEVALAQMIKHKVAPTPDNFEIWFTYSAGDNRELIDRVDSLLERNGTLARSDTEELSDTFFGGNDYAEAMENVGQEIEKTIANVSDSLKKAGKNTSAYGKALSGVTGQLDETSDPKAMKTMIDELVRATKTMEDHSRALEDKLQESTQEVSNLRSNLESIRAESLTDQLTSLPNRRAFDQTVAAAEASGEGFCLLLGDIDKFKNFNDTWGHQTGDQVLRLVARCMTDSIQGEQTAARYGGEEFAVVVPSAKLSEALQLAENIRQMVESKKVVKRSTGEDLGTITLSIGAAQFRAGESIAEIVERADACLYAAKEAGRNRVMGEAEFEASNAA